MGLLVKAAALATVGLIVALARPDVASEVSQAGHQALNQAQASFATLTGPDVSALGFSGGTKATWDRCTVDVVLNPEGQPESFDTVLTSSLAELNSASPVQFVYAGTTDEVATPGSYDGVDGPIVISFVSDGQYPLDVPGAAAEFFSSYSNSTRTSGALAINVDSFATLPTVGPGSQQAVVLHELSHGVGVGHSSDPQSLMFASTGPASTLTADVKARFAQLRPSGC